jgi:hypothetical protein
MNLLKLVYDEDDMISPAAMAKVFHITIDELSGITGIPKTSLKRVKQIKSVKTQAKLKEALEIINLITPWAESELQAFGWYRSEAIAALGNITAENAVKIGHGQSVKEYIEVISLGGYA